MPASFIQLIGRTYRNPNDVAASIHVAMLQSYESGRITWQTTGRVVDRGEVFTVTQKHDTRTSAMRQVRAMIYGRPRVEPVAMLADERTRPVLSEEQTNPERFCGYCGTRLDESGTCPADPR